MSRGGRGSRRSDHNDAETARIAREVASRAVRRLDLLEWVILFGVAALSAAAGALVALLVAHPLGLSFRMTWVVSSLLVFGVPGWLALRRSRREEREWRDRILKEIGGSDG